MATNRAFDANKKTLRSDLLTKKTKIKMYKIIIRPVAMYTTDNDFSTER